MEWTGDWLAEWGGDGRWLWLGSVAEDGGCTPFAAVSSGAGCCDPTSCGGEEVAVTVVV